MIAHMAVSLITPMASSLIQPVASSLVNPIPRKVEEGRFLPLLAFLLRVKVPGNGVRRAEKGYNSTNRNFYYYSIL